MNDALSKLHRNLSTSRFDPHEIERRQAVIGAELIARPDMVSGENFERVHDRALEFLFARYDQTFFDGTLSLALGRRPLAFRFSSRMSRAGGKTTHFKPRVPGLTERFEIAIGVDLLFESFRDDSRETRVTGLVCETRLQAMQRIFEHELLHLCEMLVWVKSNCQADRFRELSWRYFGHRASNHDLVTRGELARTQHGIVPGQVVQFWFEQNLYQGLVNRVGKRATVLVEDRSGVRFSDGKFYRKYYVPLEQLRQHR